MVLKKTKSGQIIVYTRDMLIDIIESTIITKGSLKCDLNFIDTSRITDMSYVFFKISNFVGNISQWNTKNVRNMRCMFSGSDFDGDISKWNTSNVQDMSYMFHNSRFSGDISKWDVRKVKNMKGMFQSARFFRRDLSKWEPSSLVDSSWMFLYSGYTGIFRGEVVNPASGQDI